METRKEFLGRLHARLDEFGEETLTYDEGEFWMIRGPYETIETYAEEHRLWNTALALPLTRGLHNGSHRKSSITKDGVSYRLPYLIHPLLVCRMLIDIGLPLPSEEEDILLASALCHDMIEDIPFPEHGREMIDKFGLDERVYETVKFVSKRRDFTEEEEKAFFHDIESHKLAALVKLSDRGNNVEDLYNMSVWKVHEYVGETEKFFFPMCAYAKEHYPELFLAFEVLEDKIRCLTYAAETLVDRYSAREQELRDQLEALREENGKLRAEWQSVRDL